jgi:hypothetical protein
MSALVPRRSFAFTGIPGTGVQVATERLSESLGVPASVYSIDEYIWRAFCTDARKDRSLLEVTELSSADLEEGKRPSWWHFLKLPRRRIKQFWTVAARSVLADIEMTDADSVSLVSFHASYYSDTYRMQFSAVDPLELRAFGFSAFFCLIDDIFDVQQRRDFDMAAERSCLDFERLRTPSEKFDWLVQQTADRLDQYVNWRQREIMFTDHIATSCGSPSHVVAVKHPMATMKKLLEEPAETCYLSHPITAFRGDPSFVHGASFRDFDGFVHSVRSLCALIEPTTIDEYRLLRRQVGKGKGRRLGPPLPLMTPRWPSPPGTLLGSPTDVRTPTNIETICAQANVDALGLVDHVRAVNSDTETIGDAAMSAVARLDARIAEDITWRDHTLVDQSGYVVVFRPFMNGAPSAGVRREVEYFQKLVQTGATRGACVVFHPQEDANAHATFLARRVIDTIANVPELRFRPSIAEIGADLLPEVTSAIVASSDARVAVRRICEAVKSVSESEPIVGRPGPMSEGSTAEFQRLRARDSATLEGIVSNTLAAQLTIEKMVGRVGDALVASEERLALDLIQQVRRGTRGVEYASS